MKEGTGEGDRLSVVTQFCQADDKSSVYRLVEIAGGRVEISCVKYMAL